MAQAQRIIVWKTIITVGCCYGMMHHHQGNRFAYEAFCRHSYEAKRCSFLKPSGDDCCGTAHVDYIVRLKEPLVCYETACDVLLTSSVLLMDGTTNQQLTSLVPKSLRKHCWQQQQQQLDNNIKRTSRYKNDSCNALWC